MSNAGSASPRRRSTSATGSTSRCISTGRRPQRIELSPSVRYVLLPPVFSTARLVREVPDHTDLGAMASAARPDAGRLRRHPHHRRVFLLCAHRDAVRAPPRHAGGQLDPHQHARIRPHHRRRICSAAGSAAALPIALANEVLALPELVSRRARAALQPASRPGDDGDGELWRRARRAVGRTGTAEFRCGAGSTARCSTPSRRDRAWFEARFGLPPRPVCRDVCRQAQRRKERAVARAGGRAEARRRGLPVHLLCAGQGRSRTTALLAQLGRRVTLPGVLGAGRAGSRLCLGRSVPLSVDDRRKRATPRSRRSPPGCRRCSPPAAASRRGWRIAPRFACLPGDEPAAWAAAIAALGRGPGHCRELGRAARAYIEAEVPSWDEVVDEDLLPVWQQAASRRRQRVPALTAPRRILILAPHPDDEIVACGIAAMRARRQGARLSVLYLTTGVPPREALWPWQRAGYDGARGAPARRGGAGGGSCLGSEPGGFSDIPSRCLVRHFDEAAASRRARDRRGGGRRAVGPGLRGRASGP